MVFEVVLSAFAMSTSVFASTRVCLYDGQKHDDRYGRLEHFTGEYTCKDLETGVLVSREKHTDGKKDGAYSTYDFKSGEIEEEGFYRNDKYHGVRKVYHRAKLSQEYAYVDGKVLGVQKSYNDGVLNRVYLMIPGKNSADTEFSLNKQGQLIGLTCGKNQISAKDADWCGRGGKQSTVMLYTGDGKMSETRQYLWGNLHGKSVKYNVASRKVIREEMFENGARLQEGQKHFDSSGAISSKTDCDESRKNCTETEFFPGGAQKRSEIKWSAGKKANETEFYQNGKVSREVVKNDKSFSIVEYYDTGKINSKGTYIEALDWYWNPYIPDGIVETYSPDGKLWRKETYKSGWLQGKSDFYWTMQKHEVHEESEFEKDHIVKRKIFVDKLPVSESEYMPDGSIKSHKKLKASPVEGLVI